ncbi:MAG: TRAP transporter small permease [Pigmentiphaga sp.]
MIAGHRIVGWLQGCSAAALLAMLVIVTVDVAGRHFLAKPLVGATELTQYAMAITVFTGLPVVCLRRAHISIGLLDGLFGARGRRIQGLVVGGSCAVVLAGQAWVLWNEAGWLREMGSVIGYLQLPTYPAAYGMAVLSALAAVASAWAGVNPPRLAPPSPAGAVAAGPESVHDAH